MILYDIRGERPLGPPPYSTEVMNVPTLGGAKAVSVRLQREGFVVQIHRRDTNPSAEKSNPFDPSRPDGRHARTTRSRTAILKATRELMAGGDFRPTAGSVAKRASVATRTVFALFGTTDHLWDVAIEDDAVRSAILRRVMGDRHVMPEDFEPGDADRIVRAVVLGRVA